MTENVWTVRAIEEYCTNLCEDLFDIEFNCQVIINPRLTKTLGRVCHKRVRGTVRPYKMEFSRVYLECATYSSVEDTIKHELCHYVATVKSGKKHGHDAYFKRLCREVGCKNDGTTAKHVQYNKPMPEKKPKYSVMCDGCGGMWKYYRKGNVIKNIDGCVCTRCGSSRFTVTTLRSA